MANGYKGFAQINRDANRRLREMERQYEEDILKDKNNMNTIGNLFFEQNPDKVLGEFSISDYMNKIIVKGSSEDVKNYFDKNLPNVEQPTIVTKEHIDSTKSHEEMAKNIRTYTDAFQPEVERRIEKAKKENEQILKEEKKVKESKQKSASKPIEPMASNITDIEKVEGFKVLTIEENVKKYTPDLSDNDIKAFVWYNQTLGIPMQGWEKWFMSGTNDTTVKAIEDVEYLNQQFTSIGKFQKDDTIGKLTKFSHTYKGIEYVVCRKMDGQLVIVDKNKISKPSISNASPEQLNLLVKSLSLYYINGDYVPLHIYTNTDHEILKTTLEADKEFILKEFGSEVYENAKKLITSSMMRIDHPEAEKRFKLNPFSEIARTTKAGLISETEDEVELDNEGNEVSLTVTEAFEKYIESLKSSEFQLVSKGEFRNIILYDYRERFRKDEEEEKESYKNTVANAQLEAQRLFSNFCADILDTQTKTTLNRIINLTYNRSILINTSKIPVGFVSSNLFGTGQFHLKKVQVEAFKFAVSRNNWCLALTVGFGKTSVCIALLSYFIKSGAIKKPLIVVPKPVLNNWLKEMKGYWIDVETKKVSLVEKKGSKRMFGLLTDCGFDILNLKNLDKRYRAFAPEVKKKKSLITICTYEALEKMYIGNEEIRTFIIEEWKTILTGEREETARQWSEKMIQLQSKLNSVDREADIDIHELGFDSMFVDEAHRLKNMFVNVTADKTNKVTSSFKGSSSSRALRGFYISMYLQKKHGRIGFLTATPFSNTPLEVYTMLCFLGYSELAKNNVNKITRFVDLFFNETTEPIVDSKNKIVYQSVMKNYKNKPILNTLLSNTFLYKDDPTLAGIERPCIVRYPNNDIKLMLKMSEIQKVQRDLLVGDIPQVHQFIESTTDETLRTYAEELLFKYNSNIESKMGKARGGSVVTSSKISALSPFAGSPVSIPFITEERWSELYYNSPKIRFTCDAINSIIQYHKERMETPSSVLIYCEVGLNILPYFKEALENICGFKRKISVKDDEENEKEIFDEVEIIEGTATSDAQANRRDNVCKMFNMGKVKVIIGTSTIKEGLNLQENSATLFILTPSWNSTDINQVEGRIHRQGNRFGYARVITPVVSRSMDSFIYEKYDQKKSRLADIWKNDGISETEDLTIEIKAEKQKELILDNAYEIAKIRGDMQSRIKMNILNKAQEDYDACKNAISQSGIYNELASYHLDKTSAMLQVAKDNLEIITSLAEFIKKDTDKGIEIPSMVRRLKDKIMILTEYYLQLIADIQKADESKNTADLVNILSRSYNIRSYHLSDNYDIKVETKKYLIENGIDKMKIDNLFVHDIFAKIDVYTKLDTTMSNYEAKFSQSLKRFKELYGASVLAEKYILNPEGLSLNSKMEDLNALVEMYQSKLDIFKKEIETNFTQEKDRIVPKQEYIDSLVAEAQIELDEENKLARNSDELGIIFAEKTNPQLTYLKSNVDLTKCAIKYEPCCDTNDYREEIANEVQGEKEVLENLDAKRQAEESRENEPSYIVERLKKNIPALEKMAKHLKGEDKINIEKKLKVWKSQLKTFEKKVMRDGGELEKGGEIAKIEELTY